jgi:hypothetical protein
MAYSENMNAMIKKIRALTEDFGKSAVEVFNYETSGVFTLSEPRVSEVTKTLINGHDIQSGQSSTFDSTTNKVTVVNEEFASGDVIEFTYKYNDLSDSEIFEYVRSALVFLSVYGGSTDAYKMYSSGTLAPTPEDKKIDLICVIASILIKPDYSSYKTTNMTVTYPIKMTKEEKIEKLIGDFQAGIGVIGVIEWNRTF